MDLFNKQLFIDRLLVAAGFVATSYSVSRGTECILLSCFFTVYSDHFSYITKYNYIKRQSNKITNKNTKMMKSDFFEQL